MSGLCDKMINECNNLCLHLQRVQDFLMCVSGDRLARTLFQLAICGGSLAIPNDLTPKEKPQKQAQDQKASEKKATEMPPTEGAFLISWLLGPHSPDNPLYTQYIPVLSFLFLVLMYKWLCTQLVTKRIFFAVGMCGHRCSEAVLPGLYIQLHGHGDSAVSQPAGEEISWAFQVQGVWPATSGLLSWILGQKHTGLSGDTYP